MRKKDENNKESFNKHCDCKVNETPNEEEQANENEETHENNED